MNSSELISSLRNGFRHAFVKYFDANDRKFPRLLTVVFSSLLVSCSCSLMRTLSNAQFSCRLGLIFYLVLRLAQRLSRLSCSIIVAIGI